VGRVAELVSLISAASAEQGASIGGIGAAIGRVNGMTQQNAALVGEAAAAAESLRKQSARLAAAVARFHIAGASAT
jgi:methyl-accepting chemotaxis protein